MGGRTKSVCIIGAGPSGLVAAKSLTHDHPKGTFHVTVFEQSDRIGGLWPISKEDGGMVNPDMCTNQSRHTVSFSDLAWPSTAPLFPKAWQVGQYLQRYITTYPGYDIRTGCKIIKTEYQAGKWKVHIKQNKAVSEETKISEFDNMVVTTGFFGKPKIPQVLNGFSAPIWHSSNFRNLDSLTVNNGQQPLSPGRIVVVGGQMSGVEVAASLALQLSSNANSPGTSKDTYPKFTITHVVQQPFWVMPLFFPKNPETTPERENNPSPTFLPLDLVAYNLEMRPPGPVGNTSGHITVEAAGMSKSLCTTASKWRPLYQRVVANFSLGITHDFMNKFLGSDQSNIGVPELAVTDAVRSEPPFLAVSDDYIEFVRSGVIQVVKGKVTGHPEDVSRTIVVENERQKQLIGDVSTVIFATGFEAAPSLDILPEQVLETLQLDPRGDEFPLALNVHCAASKKYPTLGFVGFYRSPYWGVMEMQARYLGKLWTGNEAAGKALDEDKTIDSMLKLRGDPRRAQFPMGDYAYLMESFREILGIKLFEKSDNASARTGLVFPPRYSYDRNNTSETQRKETMTALDIFYNTFEESSKGKFLARAVFRAMQGDWKLHREIKSFIDSYPSGTLEGTAQLLPRYSTADGFDKEYLYLEQGDFTSTTGLKFSAKRSYVYRYAEATDTLSVWFTKEDHCTVDYFFHEIHFQPDPGPLGWQAKSDHWCNPDTYDVEYNFAFKGVALEKWSPKYIVKGPNKDYTIESHFTR